MKVTKEKLEGNKVRLQIEVGPEKTDRAINQAYRKIVQQVNIPGFRKGKVPKKILQARFGENIFDQDAIEILFPEVYQEAVKDAEISPIAQPVLEDYTIEEGKGTSFKVEVEVKPEVKLGKYTGLDLVMEYEEVKEEEIEEQLNMLRERRAQLVPADREEVQEDDFVVIDFVGRLEGEEEPFEGGSAEGYLLQIGSGTFIPGFEEQLVGAKTGDEVKVEVEFPEDYPQEDLAGQKAIFDVKINEIKVKEMPEADDEFAKDLGEYENLDELKAKIRETLETEKQREADALFQEKLFEKIAEDVEVDVPETMIETELERMYRDYAYRLSQQGIQIEDFMSRVGTTKEEWMNDRREVAEKRVRNNLILEAINKEEGIEVSEEEIYNKVKETFLNDQDDEKAQELIERMKKSGTYEDIKYSIKLDKTMDFLFDENIKEKKVVDSLYSQDENTSEDEETGEE